MSCHTKLSPNKQDGHQALSQPIVLASFLALLPSPVQYHAQSLTAATDSSTSKKKSPKNRAASSARGASLNSALKLSSRSLSWPSTQRISFASNTVLPDGEAKHLFLNSAVIVSLQVDKRLSGSPTHHFQFVDKHLPLIGRINLSMLVREIGVGVGKVT